MHGRINTIFFAVFGLIVGILSAIAGIIAGFAVLAEHLAGRGATVSMYLLSSGLFIAGAAGIASFVALQPWKILR